MDKRQHLEELHQLLIDTTQEYRFDFLYDKLLSEISNESDNTKSKYFKDLETTRDKQAAEYINAKSKKPKSDFYSLFSDFVRHFKNDISDELRRLPIK